MEFEDKDANMQQKLDDVRDKKTKLEQNERLKRDLMVGLDRRCKKQYGCVSVGHLN